MHVQDNVTVKMLNRSCWEALGISRQLASGGFTRSVNNVLMVAYFIEAKFGGCEWVVVRECVIALIVAGFWLWSVVAEVVSSMETDSYKCARPSWVPDCTSWWHHSLRSSVQSALIYDHLFWGVVRKDVAVGSTWSHHCWKPQATD